MLIIQDLKPTLNVQTDSIRAKLFTRSQRNKISTLYLHDHKETKYLLLFSLIYIQTTMKQSLYLDNDGSTIGTSDSISFNFPTEVF